jgi:tetratricopeptide (TPR) repeat protein
MLANQKKYQEATKVYTKVINRNNKIQLAWYERGMCFAHLNNYSLALRDFDKVIALKTVGGYIMELNSEAAPILGDEARFQVPYDDVIYQRATVKADIDSLESAFNDFKFLVERNYKKSNCSAWQGLLYLQAGDTQTACDYFQKAKTFAQTDFDKTNAERELKKHCDTVNNNR